MNMGKFGAEKAKGAHEIRLSVRYLVD